MSAALALADVACVRGGRMLFAGVSLSLTAGSAGLVAGPNGTGKSSLLRLAAGLLPPFAGTVTRSGALALLGEASALDVERPLHDALAFWARLDGAPEPGTRVADALAAMALADIATVPVRLLSTGQRRRAAMARVIASGAPIWLLDEPASGLDLAAVERLEAVIAQHRAGGGIVLLATHQALALPDARVLDLASVAA